MQCMYSKEIQTAMHMWLANAAYIDGNGNYHVKGYKVSRDTTTR